MRKVFLSGAAGAALLAGLLLPPATAAGWSPALFDAADICGGTARLLARHPGAAPLVHVADAAIADDVDLMEKLGLIEGHLKIGRELLAANLAKDALPHFGHPVAELYEYLAPVIVRTGARPFDGDLKALEMAVKANPQDPAIAGLFDRAMAGVAALRATIPAVKQAERNFNLKVVALLLEDIAGDYEGSIDKGRHASRVEYHDALGFLHYVKTYVEGARAHGDTATWGKVQAELKRLDAALPGLKPPAKPLTTPERINGMAERVAAMAAGA